MARLHGSIEDKHEIPDRLRQDGMEVVYEVRGAVLHELLTGGPPDFETTGPGSGLDEVAWREGSTGWLDEPLEPPPGPDSSAGSSLLFRLALSTAALLVLFVFARGFWWPAPERRGDAPEWAVGSHPRTAPAPPAAPSAPVSPFPDAVEPEEPSPEPTLVEELGGFAPEPVPPPPPERRAPEPAVLLETSPEPEPPQRSVSRPAPAPIPESASLARHVSQPWEEGPQPAGLIKPGPGVEEPVPLEFPRYSYPAAARGTGLQVDVRLALLVDERGRVIDARVREGTPDLGFSEAALAVAKRIPFQPASRYDVPGKMWTEVILEFVE
jgi:periplasmic protein TonB